MITGNVESLLKRAFLFIEDKDLESADRYCEKVLDIDPENARAYVAKLMIDCGVTYQDDLGKLDESFDDNANYKKAIRFADDDLAATLQGYLDTIRETQENRAKDEKYMSACDLMEDDQIDSYKKAISIFSSIIEWRDSRFKIMELKEATYEKACSLIDFDNKELSIREKFLRCEQAINYLELIEEYKDSLKLLNECKEIKVKLELEHSTESKKDERISNVIGWCAILITFIFFLIAVFTGI